MLVGIQRDTDRPVAMRFRQDLPSSRVEEADGAVEGVRIDRQQSTGA